MVSYKTFLVFSSRYSGKRLWFDKTQITQSTAWDAFISFENDSRIKRWNVVHSAENIHLKRTLQIVSSKNILIFYQSVPESNITRLIKFKVLDIDMSDFNLSWILMIKSILLISRFNFTRVTKHFLQSKIMFGVWITNELFMLLGVKKVW